MRLQDVVIGVDQALDDTGVALVLPGRAVENGRAKKLTDFLLEFLPVADSRFAGRESELSLLLRDLKSFPLVLPPEGRKRKATPFGFWIPGSDGGLVLHFLLSNSVSQGAEYLLADLSAQKLSMFVRAVRESIPSEEPKVILEGLALRGNMRCIQILPVLAIVYAAFMRSLHASSGLSMERVGHINIGTWKRAFVGKGNAEKREIKDKLVSMGAHKDISDDESDAMAMALTLSSRHEAVAGGFNAGGRILPRADETPREPEAKHSAANKQTQAQSSGAEDIID